MRRHVIFEPQAFEDYSNSLQWGRFSVLAPAVTQAIRGIDKPIFDITTPPATQEPDGTWSRKLLRLGKHRLVYQINDEEIRIISCK